MFNYHYNIMTRFDLVYTEPFFNMKNMTQLPEKKNSNADIP